MKFGDFTAMDQENRLELKWSVVVLIWGALHYCAMGREGRSSPAGFIARAERLEYIEFTIPVICAGPQMISIQVSAKNDPQRRVSLKKGQ